MSLLLALAAQEVPDFSVIHSSMHTQEKARSVAGSLSPVSPAPAVCFLLRMLPEPRQAHLLGTRPACGSEAAGRGCAGAEQGGEDTTSSACRAAPCTETIPLQELSPRQNRHPTYARHWGNGACQEEEALAATKTHSCVLPPPRIRSVHRCNLPQTPAGHSELGQGRNASTSHALRLGK